MTEVPKNKVCWVKGCENEQVPDSLYCEEHEKSEEVPELQKPGVIGGPNIPTT